MKKIVYATVVFALIVLSENSCKKDNKVSPGPLYNMDFTISAGASPLVPGPGHVVTNAAMRYYINYVQFYVGFPRLVKSDGTEVPITNLFVVEFNDDPFATPNLVYNNQFTFPVPAGTYTGIKFGIGVPDTIADTIDHFHYGISDPLSANYWGMLWPGTDTVIRNIAIEVLADTSVAQNLPVNRLYDFHILEAEPRSQPLHLYSTLFFPDAFTVGNGDSHTATFNLDFNNVIFNNTNPINLVNSVSTDMNTSSNIPIGEQINKNFYNSLTLK